MEHVLRIKNGDSIRLTVESQAAYTLSVESLGVGKHPPPPGPINLLSELPRHPHPQAPPAWWQRDPSQITGITIHHTGVETPQIAAQIHVNKGRPSIEYHYFVGYEGQLYQCLAPEEGCWHDHTGHRNQHLAIALAGYHHKSPPQDAQIHALADITAWAMGEYHIAVEDVRGHNDWAWAAAGVRTVCPGWDAAGWRDRFFDVLRSKLR